MTQAPITGSDFRTFFPNLEGPDREKLQQLETVEFPTGPIHIGYYLQKDKDIGTILHCRVARIDGSPDLPRMKVMQYLVTKFPNVSFLEIYPKEEDFIDEGNTYHFFGILKNPLQDLIVRIQKDILGMLPGGEFGGGISYHVGAPDIGYKGAWEKFRALQGGNIVEPGFLHFGGPHAKLPRGVLEIITSTQVRLPNLRELRNL